jgi:AcrR family transcriptional regulator
MASKARRRILDTAVEFAENGFYRTGIGMIAKAAELDETTIFHVCTDKSHE